MFNLQASLKFKKEDAEKKVISTFFKANVDRKKISLKEDILSLDLSFSENPPEDLISVLIDCELISMCCNQLDENSESSAISSTTIAETKRTVEEKKKRGRRPKKVENKEVKLKCITNNQSFDKFLNSLDSSLSIEDKIKMILEQIGLKSLKEDLQNYIIEISNIAVKKGLSIEDTLKESSIPEGLQTTVRIHYSNLVNIFASKYDSSAKIDLTTFLSDLREVIMASCKL